MFNIYRIAAVSPELRSADVYGNCAVMAEYYRRACEENAGIVIFPGFSLTGKSCGKLFQRADLLKSALDAAEKFASQTGNSVAVFGLPLMAGSKAAEAAAIAQNGKIIAFIIRKNPDIPGFSANLPQNQKFHDSNKVFDAGITFSVNFPGCYPSSQANLQIYCGAEPEVPGSWNRLENFFRTVSSTSECVSAGAYSGCGESTTDCVYGGGLIICDCGKTAASRPSPAALPGMIYADIDMEKIACMQLQACKNDLPADIVKIDAISETDDLKYFCNPAHPFLPSSSEERENFCRETFELQCIGLYERFRRCGAKKFILGISGGLDSTLALAVLILICRKYDLPAETILAVTMPGFGTTGRTRNNALKLAAIAGAEIREIPIGDACIQHFKDIDHDPSLRNSVYENSQARERTQILMDIANAVNGIVVGTGDLSEIALGWSTFNGDQMAMYSVNSSIPKTNIAAMLEYIKKLIPEAADILQDVIDTPVSPELLPADGEGKIAQKTEAILGAYELHDYLLYHFYAGISSPEKLLYLIKNAFKDKYPDTELIRVRDLFLKRFFTQQFKRTAGPDGVQAGVVSLSARSAWQMPSDMPPVCWQTK